MFKGNTDSHSVRHSYLEHPVTARFLRIHVHDWHEHPSLRLEIVGCQECNTIISSLPFTQIEASSHKSWRRRHTCGPMDGHIHASGGWCPRRSNGELISWALTDLIINPGRGLKPPMYFPFRDFLDGLVCYIVVT